MAEMTEKTLRGKRLVLSGTVVGDKMDKTVVIAVRRMVKAPKYEKRYYHTSKVVAHDEKNEAAIGDVVEVMETRPISKTKRWRVVRVLKTAAKLA